MKETAEEVARAMVAEADILAMLGDQPLSSLKVVEKLKGFAERIFNANVPAAVSPANLPLDIPPTSEPIQPGTPKMMPGEKPHMRRDVAAGILMDLMRKRTMSVDHVEALKMGAHWLMKKHFEKQRYHAKRREAAASVPAVPTVPTVPATTTEA